MLGLHKSCLDEAIRADAMNARAFLQLVSLSLSNRPSINPSFLAIPLKARLTVDGCKPFATRGLLYYSFLSHNHSLNPRLTVYMERISHPGTAISSLITANPRNDTLISLLHDAEGPDAKFIAAKVGSTNFV